MRTFQVEWTWVVLASEALCFTEIVSKVFWGVDGVNLSITEGMIVVKAVDFDCYTEFANITYKYFVYGTLFLCFEFFFK